MHGMAAAELQPSAMIKAEHRGGDAMALAEPAALKSEGGGLDLAQSTLTDVDAGDDAAKPPSDATGQPSNSMNP